MFPFGIVPASTCRGHPARTDSAVYEAETLGLLACRLRPSAIRCREASPPPSPRRSRSLRRRYSGRAGRSYRSSTIATRTPPGRSHDEIVQIVRLERGQFVVRNAELLSSPSDPSVPKRPKPIPHGTSRRGRLGHLCHAVLDQVVQHETSALIRPFREPAVR